MNNNGPAGRRRHLHLRPYLWGLAAFGQPGVERVLDLLRREFKMVVHQMGATTINQITRNSIVEM